MMNLTIDQNNLHLILPSKMAWLASMLADDENISVVDAIKKWFIRQMRSFYHA